MTLSSNTPGVHQSDEMYELLEMAECLCCGGETETPVRLVPRGQAVLCLDCAETIRYEIRGVDESA